MSTSILLIAHAPLAHALRECALHVFADCGDAVAALDVPPHEPPEQTLANARALLAGLATDAEIAGFFTLTLVRNPWDRALSYYTWLRAQAFAHPAVGLAKALSFSGFLNHPQTMTAFRLWPYAAYMRDRHGVERASLYARLEALDRDLAPFEAHLGFALPAIARANESDRPRDWRPAYSDSDAALIATLCAVDIARFHYSFDGAV